jgi:hypothetical protein
MYAVKPNISYYTDILFWYRFENKIQQNHHFQILFELKCAYNQTLIKSFIE